MSPKKIACMAGWGIILLISIAVESAWGKVDQATRYLERSASLTGPTGWINIPSASVPGSGQLSAGIHLNKAKVNFGLWEVLEGGFFFDADRLGEQFEPYRNLSRWDLAEKNVPGFIREAFRGQGKIKLIDQDWGGVSLAAGVEEQDGYVVMQRFFPGLSRVSMVAGWGEGRFSQGFAGLGKTLFPGAELLFEYDGRGINMGMRLLLAPNLIMTYAGRNLDTVGEVKNLGQVISQHLSFGITYVEQLW
ncbi:MAG: hypothetical protein AB1439_06770 [candidate division FCPU426 bacterium]